MKKKTKFDLLLLLKKIKKNKSVSEYNTLSNEKRKLISIKRSLIELLKISNFPKNIITNSREIKQISHYQNELQNRLKISKNREYFLNQEINSNMKKIAELKKQEELILEKLKIDNKKEQSKMENKNEVVSLNKGTI